MIRISFIIPLYNLERYIVDCIESIVSSSIHDTEIIVWNDGSKDNGPQLVRELKKDYSHITLVNSDNRGVSNSRNEALYIARGEYVWFVDGDDLVKSKNLNAIVDTLYSSKPEILIFNWQSLELNGVISDGINNFSKSFIASGCDIYMKKHLNMAPWSYIYNRAFLLNNNISFPIDYRTCEDIQFNQKALFHARKVVATPIVGYIYRHRHNSATKGQGYRVANDHIRRLKDELAYFSEYKDWRFLSEVIYRNLREINVWLFWTDRREELFIKLREILRNFQYKKRPLFSIQTGYFYLMKYSPKLVFEIQLQLNIIKRKLKGQYVKQ